LLLGQSKPKEAPGGKDRLFINIPTEKLSLFFLSLSLVRAHKFAIEEFQHKAGYGDSSKWTHVADCLGGYITTKAIKNRTTVKNRIRTPLLIAINEDR